MGQILVEMGFLGATALEALLQADPQAATLTSPAAPAGAQSAPSSLDELERGPFPRPFGRYQIQGVLGKGGMGLVFRANDPVLGIEVALKVCTARDEGVRQRFLEEPRHMARIDHAHVAKVFDAGEVAARPYFTMQLCTGSLQQLIRAHDGLEPQRSAELLHKHAT